MGSLVLLAKPPKPTPGLHPPSLEPSRPPQDGGLPRPAPPRPPLPGQGGSSWYQQADERVAVQLLCHGSPRKPRRLRDANPLHVLWTSARHPCSHNLHHNKGNNRIGGMQIFGHLLVGESDAKSPTWSFA